MRIIPIKDLQDTVKISKMAKETNEPIFVTKNGYEDLVIMSHESYRRALAKHFINEKLAKSEESLKNGGKTVNASEYIKQLEAKYGF